MTFRNEARTDSAPRRGTIPQGKGREGIRKRSGTKPQIAFSTHLQSRSSEPGDAAKTIRGGGGHDHAKCCRYLLCAHPTCCGYQGQR